MVCEDCEDCDDREDLEDRELCVDRDDCRDELLEERVEWEELLVFSELE